jgi:arylsulfatase A-like enzyme
VSPCDHGITNDRFAVPPHLHRLRPLPREVALAGLQTTGIVREVPWPLRPLARRIVRELGLAQSHFALPQARELLRRALPALRDQRDGLIVMHWPDCDAIGHRYGWMSQAYLAAVSCMDHALGAMRAVLRESAHETLLVALADHGGGGWVATHHDSAHPLDCTIPILLSGAGVVPQVLDGTYTLLDAPPTVLWALGLPVPAPWVGTPMIDAFCQPGVASVHAPRVQSSSRVAHAPRLGVA